MSDLVGSTGAAARAADVLLRALGGRKVLLRMPAPAVPGDITEQLGLEAPTFQDLVLAPVVYRKARSTVAQGKAVRCELVVSAAAVEAIVGSLAYTSASALFSEAYGIWADGELLEIQFAAAEEAFEKPYVYRLILRVPLAQTT